MRTKCSALPNPLTEQIAPKVVRGAHFFGASCALRVHRHHPMFSLKID
jgi:hypothetical protein